MSMPMFAPKLLNGFRPSAINLESSLGESPRYCAATANDIWLGYFARSSLAVIDALAAKRREPFCKIFIKVTEQLGIVRVTGLTNRQVRLIIIKDFSAKVQPGQKVAIVGPTGAGKTTMVNLLMRFFEVNSGSIRIDGVPTSELRREDVHKLFGMVLQDTWLFEGTVRENLVYNMEGITEEQLEKVCRACGLDKFIHTLPNGFDTVLSEATSISAGQKQLLTIARAMLQNAPMLILDEATSSVDTRTELLIQRAMDRLTEGRTSFVIAHRLSTIKNADLILVMRDGDVIESGTHDQLMNKGGFYAELYNSQFDQAS